jgi:hypothetical protein
MARGQEKSSARDEVSLGGKPVKNMKRGECIKWLNPRRQWIGLDAYPKKTPFQKPADVKTELKELKDEILASLTEGIYDSWYEGAPPPADAVHAYDRDVEPKDPGFHCDTDLWTASFHGRLAEVDMYLKIGITVDEKQASYPAQTALHQAASAGQLDMCKYLIKERANVSMVDENGNTPLHLAARFNHVDVVAFLRDNQSNSLEVDVLNRDFFTPRQLAESRGMVEAANLLPEIKQLRKNKIRHMGRFRSSKLVGGSKKSGAAAQKTSVVVEESGGVLDLMEEQPVIESNQQDSDVGGEEAPAPASGGITL